MSLFPRAIRSLTPTALRSRPQPQQIRHAHAAVRDEDGAGSVSSDNASKPSRYRKPLPEREQYTPFSSSSASSTPEPDLKGKGKARDPTTENYRFPTKGANGGSPSPFDILGLGRDASSADIKAQYYHLARLLHPDSSHPSSSAANFQTLSRAYKLLSDPPSRRQYLQSNYGWSPDGTANPYEFDPMMAEILRRKRDGAGRRGRSDGGRGAWGTYGPDGKWQPAKEYQYQGAGDPKYMSHSSFGSMLIFLAIVVGWFQYHRISMISENRREYLDAQHMDASRALQQAREDAKKYGPMRMEAIQRRVNELEAMKQLAKQEAEAQVRAEAMSRIAAPPPPRPAE